MKAELLSFFVSRHPGYRVTTKDQVALEYPDKMEDQVETIRWELREGTQVFSGVVVVNHTRRVIGIGAR